MSNFVDHTVEVQSAWWRAHKLFVHDLTRQTHESTDGNWTGAELLVRSISLRQQGADVIRIEGRDFSIENGLAADRWQDDNGNYHWRGHADFEDGAASRSVG